MEIRVPVHIGYPEVIIRQADTGDPHSLTIELPPASLGKVTLPRSFFSASVNNKLSDERPSDEFRYGAGRMMAERDLG